jgi:hypothetical protein
LSGGFGNRAPEGYQREGAASANPISEEVHAAALQGLQRGAN